MRRNFVAFGLEFIEMEDHIMILPYPDGSLGDWQSLEGITYDELFAKSQKFRKAERFYGFIERYMA